MTVLETLAGYALAWVFLAVVAAGWGIGRLAAMRRKGGK